MLREPALRWGFQPRSHPARRFAVHSLSWRFSLLAFVASSHADYEYPEVNTHELAARDEDANARVAVDPVSDNKRVGVIAEDECAQSWRD
jgi:hypothetical protein